MKYLIDTNVCVFIIRKRSERILKKLTSTSAGEVGLSSITVAELEFGVYKSKFYEQAREALDSFLPSFPIVSFDNGAAVHYGKLRADLESRGMRIGAMDMLIAAQGLQHNLTVVTHNVKEFTRVSGLRVEDWY